MRINAFAKRGYTLRIPSDKEVFSTKRTLFGDKSSTLFGYNNAQIIEVVTKGADPRYLTYLKRLNIPYIIAGEDEIDITLALEKLNSRFGVEKLLLEGGSVVNGYFLRADAVDELSLVVSPVVADKDSKPLFFDAACEAFSLENIQIFGDGILWMNYCKE